MASICGQQTASLRLEPHCYAQIRRNCCWFGARVRRIIGAWDAVNPTCTEELFMNLLTMMRIVFWSFFGVRKRASHQADFAAVKVPLLPVVAVLLAAAFGAVLFSLAHIAVHIAH